MHPSCRMISRRFRYTDLDMISKITIISPPTLKDNFKSEIHKHIHLNDLKKK